MKSFASHEVVSLEDLKEGRAREIAVKKPPSKKCHIHEEPLGIYCFDCSSLICRDCTVTIHKEHKFEFSKVAAPITKKKLLEDLNPLREVTANMSSAIEVLQTTKQEVEVQGDSVTKTIHTSFNGLQQILEKHKQQLLTEAASKVQEKMDKLLAQEKNLSLANAEVQSILDYTERFVGHCSDNEVVSMHAEIRRRIEREIEEHSKSGRSVEPVEEADMGVEVRCAEDLQQLCQTKANITQLIDPARCTVRGEGVETAEVHKTAEVTLTANTLTKNKTTRHSAVVVGQLKSLYDGSIIQFDVEQSGPGEYHIQYTPTVRGRHELTVSVDGQQVAGSPFPVFVSIPPTQLGKPVKVWDKIRLPTGVTANSEGDIIVTEFNADIVKFDKDGKKHVLVEHSKCMLLKLIAVAADKEDNIYCTDLNFNKIMRCNKNGGNVQVYEVKQVKGPGYRGVTIVEDEVMLCENNNTGTIMVYDKELKYVKRIEHCGMGEFRGVSADNQGNLYVTDYTKFRIHVFSNDGVFLRSFGCDGNGVGRLNGPCGVCVSGQYVYVTNTSGHNVSVFTTAGDHVTTFGEQGNKEGSFISPYHIFVNHFVFVTDLNNNRIQCF